jgi:3-oxoacyl-[acyl-carrier protein] reductase
MRLDGKVVIVTGGGLGIGKIYCRALAEEGARVVGADIVSEAAEEVAESIRREGGEALSVAVDVTSPESAEAMAEQVVGRFGRIDVLVNNAAMYSAILPKKHFTEIPPDEWDRLMAVNTKGVFLCVKAVLPAMKEQGSGKVINIASATAFSGAPGFLHYVASKAAVIGMTRALARELGADNITANAIAPGLTSSDTSDGLVPDDDVQHQVRARALNRVEVPEDIVGTLLFLASSDSDFVNGQTIVVDGGGILH